MGAQESKCGVENCLDDNAPSTPVSTPTAMSLSDPRSPSVNVARTPLDLVFSSKFNNKQLLADDPRSPTTEFQRTPIVIGAASKSGRQSLIHKAALNLTESRKAVPPKLLDSSPICRPSSDINKRKSLVGVLETNIDFTETDLDDVQARSDLNKTLPGRITDDCVTPLTNKIQSQMICLNLKDIAAPNFDDNNSDDDNNVAPNFDDTDANVKDVVNFDITDDVVKKTDEESINITAHVKSFDRKLSTLIYEDDSCNNINIKMPKVKDNNHTPLKLRNSNEVPQKATTKLKVSNKPRKLEGHSRIPVLKDIYRKKGVQCENTPPQQLEKRRAKVSRWDGDVTLII